MRNLLFVFIILNILFISCGYRKNLKCSNCSDRKVVLKAVDQFAKKRLDSEIKNYQIQIEEDKSFYVITYTNTEVLKDLKFGGGIFLKILKKDCRIIDYKKFK